MRASEVRAAIAAAIEAIEPDHKAHADDRFIHVRAGLFEESEDIPDRTFFVQLMAPPARVADQMPGALWEVAFEVRVGYADSPEAADRIGLDVERIYDAVDGLMVDHSGIALTSVLSTTLAEAPGFIGVYVQIAVRYHLSGIF